MSNQIQNYMYFKGATTSNSDGNSKYRNMARLAYLDIDANEYLRDTGNFDVCYFHKYPFNILCNFYPSNFRMDGVEINSMEAFLQSLKIDDPTLQRKVCKMFGPSSKKIGNYYKYYKNFDRKSLYWSGKKYDRYSGEYKDLLSRAYEAKYRDDAEYRKVIQMSEGYNLTHKIGKQDPNETILTEEEFMEQLNKLKKHNQNIKIPISEITTKCTHQEQSFNKLKDLEKLHIKNLFMLDDKIICGAPITEGDNKKYLSQIKQVGIKTIIDFNSKEDKDKKALCQRYGLNYFSIPINDFRTRTKEVMAKMPEFINYMQNSTSYLECNNSLNEASIGMCANYLFNPNAYLGNAIMFPDNTMASKKALIKDVEDFVALTRANQQDLMQKIQILKDMNELEYYE